MSLRLLNEPARLAGASLLRLQSDERLVTLAAGGHEAAFAVIVDRYRPALLRYCTGLVGSARAEDVVQQALVNAHASLLRTPDVRSLRPWLYRIAHNAALNTLRAVRDDIPLDPSHADPAGDPAERPNAASGYARRSPPSRPCPSVSGPRCCCASSRAARTTRSPTRSA